MTNKDDVSKFVPKYQIPEYNIEISNRTRNPYETHKSRLIQGSEEQCL